MFKLFRVLSVISLHLIMPLVLTIIFTITYGYGISKVIGELEYIAIVFFSSSIAFIVSRDDRYWKYLEWVSPFVILAIGLFLTCHYLKDIWFWISFIVLIVATIVCGFFTIMLRSMNVQ